MAPQVARLAKTHGDKVVVLKVDVSRYGRMAQKAGVRGIPDTRLFYQGRQIERKVGGMFFEEMERMVLKHEKKLPPVVNEAANVVPVKVDQPKGSIEPMKEDWLPPGVTRQ